MADSITVGVIGGTGEVGKQVIYSLCVKGATHVKRIVLYVRHAVTLNDLYTDEKAKIIAPFFESAVEQRIIDFEKADQEVSFEGVTVVFSCLGSTIKKAGSQEAFAKVDHEYAMAMATKAKHDGVKVMVLCSAVGADVNSRFFYNRVKGMVERDMSDLKFARLGIFRPGLLLCCRKESRPAETVARYIIGPLDFMKYTSIQTAVLGRVMAEYGLMAQQEDDAEAIVNIYGNHEISIMGQSDAALTKAVHRTAIDTKSDTAATTPSTLDAAPAKAVDSDLEKRETTVD